jgi:hypothetical protein
MNTRFYFESIGKSVCRNLRHGLGKSWCRVVRAVQIGVFQQSLIDVTNLPVRFDIAGVHRVESLEIASDAAQGVPLV